MNILLVAKAEGAATGVSGQLAALGRPPSAQAQSGHDALELARDTWFDLALVEIGRDGDDAERLSVAMNLQAVAHVPVVFLVAEGASEAIVRRARSTVPRGFLFEPLTKGALESVLELAESSSPASPGSAKRLKLGTRPDPLVFATAASPLSIEMRFRAVSEATSDLVTILDREGCVLYDTPSIERLLGYAPGSRIGQSSTTLVHPEDLAGVRECVERSLRPGAAPAVRQYRIQHGDGSWRTFESTWRPHPDACPLAAVVVVSRDITLQRALESQLARADRLASLGILATTVGHEINNPLTYVLANLENIAARLPELAGACGDLGDAAYEGRSGEAAALTELAEQARQAADGARRIARIVRDLKTFVRGDDEPDAPVDLETVLECAVAMVANQIRHRARIVKEYGVVPATAGNPNRLVQVFLNLLLNALQAMPEQDDGSNEIHLRTWAEGGEVFAEVVDTGCGIPAANLDRLFDPFFTTKPAGIGTGLGLAISRAIVEAHAGSIEVESEVGKGSRFVVRLPIRAVSEALPRTPAVRSRPKVRPVRALVVDDDPLVCALMKRMLGRTYQVTTTDSVHRAFDILDAGNRFDVILCDLMMPDGPGTLLYDRLSERNPSLARRIVFVTGGAFTESARAFFERIPNVRLDKPFGADELRGAVEEVLASPGAGASEPPAAPRP